MADNVVIAFKTDLATFRKELDEVKGKVSGLGNESGKVGKKVSKDFKDTETASAKLKAGITGIGTAMVAAFTVQAVVQFGKAIFNITAEFQKFRAVLTNTLGSQSEADKALKRITQFASETPFSVQELTASFVKLANQGFKPTNDEMRKLGDLASSTGKGFDQLTEAIIDAQTGEFERLKEFGIRAEKQGDRVKFTFKGVQTQTEFTSDSIRKYVLSLGDLQGVSGASEAISKTLGGQLSNLGDNFDRLLLILGKDSEGGFSGALSATNTTLQELGNTLEDKPSKLDALKEAIISVSQPFLDLWENIKSILSPLQDLTDKGTAFENIVWAWSKVMKATFVPLKLIITSFITLTDALIVVGKGFRNLKHVFDDKPFENTGIEKLKNDIFKLKDIVTLQDGAFEHSKETIDKETTAKEDNIDKTKELTKEQKKLIEEMNKFASKDVKKAESIDGIKQFEDQKKAELKLIEDTNKAELEHDEKLNKQLNSADTEARLRDYKDAQKNIDKKNEYEIEQARKTADEKQRINEELVQAGVQVATELTSAIFEIQQRERDSRYYHDLSSLEKQRDAELNFKGATEQGKAEINAKYDEKRKKILTEQFEAKKRAAIIETNINGAIAVVSALPNYILAALVGVTTGIQLGVIASQPTPEFHKGEVNINPDKKNAKGEFDAKLIKGESVINAISTAKYERELQAMNSNKFEDLVISKYVVPALRKQQEEIAKNQGILLGSNIAQSIALNSGKFNDGNITQWLSIVNKTSKENARLISKSLGNKRNYARSV